ncbi:MAG: hypothetical protein ACRD12_11870 [Acidimicrobiales bacterium]
MSEHRVRYEGPRSLAMQAARLLADSQGIELRSAGSPEPLSDSAGETGLTLTVEGTAEAVQAALERIQAALSSGARLRVVEGPAPPA